MHRAIALTVELPRLRVQAGTVPVRGEGLKIPFSIPAPGLVTITASPLRKTQDGERFCTDLGSVVLQESLVLNGLSSH